MAISVWRFPDPLHLTRLLLHVIDTVQKMMDDIIKNSTSRCVLMFQKYKHIFVYYVFCFLIANYLHW